jgi:hypothetical protein
VQFHHADRAYVYAFDPTPQQVSMLRSHVGGSRFAYNTLLGLVKDNWEENHAKKEAGIEVTQEDWVDTGHFGLLYLWALCRYLHKSHYVESPIM